MNKICILIQTVPVYLKNFHDSSDICPMGFIYAIQICEISHQTFGPSHRKCPMCPMIFMNTAVLKFVSRDPDLLNVVFSMYQAVSTYVNFLFCMFCFAYFRPTKKSVNNDEFIPNTKRWVLSQKD